MNKMISEERGNRAELFKKAISRLKNKTAIEPLSGTYTGSLALSP